MPEPSPLARLADHLLEEGLETFIAEARAANRSWDWIARELYLRTDRQVTANGVTVAAWAERIDEGVA